MSLKYLLEIIHLKIMLIKISIDLLLNAINKE